MKTEMKFALAIFAMAIAGCADRPYVPATAIYDSAALIDKQGMTTVRVHRVQQLTGAGLGEKCPLVLSLDSIKVAGLQQNQYVDLYLKPGEHTLEVRLACAYTSMKGRLKFTAFGDRQEFKTELGDAGQYRLWQTK